MLKSLSPDLSAITANFRYTTLAIVAILQICYFHLCYRISPILRMRIATAELLPHVLYIRFVFARSSRIMMIVNALVGLLMTVSMFQTGFALPLNGYTDLPLEDSTTASTIEPTSTSGTTLDSITTATPTFDSTPTLAPLIPYRTTVVPHLTTQALPFDLDAFWAKYLVYRESLPPIEQEREHVRQLLNKRNPYFEPYRHVNQTWGLKGMTDEEYRTNVLIPYWNAEQEEQHWMWNSTIEQLPTYMDAFLIIQNGTGPMKQPAYLSPHDYILLCNQITNQNWTNCNYTARLCEKVCYWQIWYPGYEQDFYKHTKVIVFDSLTDGLKETYFPKGQKKIPKNALENEEIQDDSFEWEHELGVDSHPFEDEIQILPN